MSEPVIILRRCLVTTFHIISIVVFTLVGLSSPPISILSPVARAISECDKFAIEKGSLIADSKICEVKCSNNAPTSTGNTAPEGSTQELAQQMLDNANITYWTNNGVNTKDIVVAMSQGKKAYTTSPEAPSKEVDINTNILKFILEAAESGKVMVNALTDKDHSSTSNHYKGLAVDLDKNPGNTSVPLEKLNEVAEKYGGKKNSETNHHHYDFSTDVEVSPATDAPTTSPSCCPVSGSGASGELSQNIPAVWRSLIAETAPTYPNVDPNLVAVVLWVENRGWPEYKTSGWGESDAGAAGPWQFIKSTWDSMGTDGDGDGRKDRDNPKDAVHAAFKHHEGSAGKPIAAEFDGNAESSFQKIIMRRNDTNLLYYAAKYNGGARTGPRDVKLTDFPRGENADYTILSYWLLATDFQKTWTTSGTWGEFVDAYVGPAVSGNPSTTASNNSSPAGCTDSVNGSVAGFPLIATKSTLKAGVDGAVWCYITSQSCKHHDYDAADIHAPIGTKVIAAQAGRVVGMKDSQGSSNGSHVTILGSDNNVYYYTHMEYGSIQVAEGEDVTIGQELGAVGSEADGAKPHLHFDMQPPPATNRPSCSSAECASTTWIDVQPLLWPLYERLPE